MMAQELLMHMTLMQVRFSVGDCFYHASPDEAEEKLQEGEKSPCAAFMCIQMLGYISSGRLLLWQGIPSQNSLMCLAMHIDSTVLHARTS